MYRAFTIQNADALGFEGRDLLIAEYKRFCSDKKATVTKEELRDIILSSERISAEDLKKKLAPKIGAQIFISHSHVDETLAQALAGYLYHCFGLVSFVDPLFWKDIDELAEELNKSHLYTGQDGKNYYNHTKTRWVENRCDVILSTALAEAMDECECILFLGTDNYFLPSEDSLAGRQTNSPWISMEVEFAGLLKTRIPARMKGKAFEDTLLEHRFASKDSLPQIAFQADTSSFPSISKDDFDAWLDEPKADHPLDTLDSLYNRFRGKI